MSTETKQPNGPVKYFGIVNSKGEIQMLEMSREAWIKNVMQIYPERTREETEALWDKLFKVESKPVEK